MLEEDEQLQANLEAEQESLEAYADAIAEQELTLLEEEEKARYMKQEEEHEFLEASDSFREVILPEEQVMAFLNRKKQKL